MCGITGVIALNNVNKGIVEKMTNVISHRGPDGEGFFYGDNYVFGHRRLSIIDLSEAGKQPMTYLESRYIITFNGEIYNYLELKDELECNGYKFKTNTDTEVIMASYDFWGVDCLNKFNGMWAFVLFDKVKQMFLLSRDRFGIKPLYYYCSNGVFVFASEIKSLLSCDYVKTEINNEYIQSYIKEGPIDYGRETAFNNIFRFNFSSYVECDLNTLIQNKWTYEKYWEYPKVTLSKQPFNKIEAEKYAKKYYNLLKDSVKLRLRSDVKVGSALSGGLDSSSIVYLVNKILREEGKTDLQETFSSVYKHEKTKDCDESEYVNILAKDLKVNSNQIEPNEEDIPEEHEKMIYMMETPPESTCMSGWHTFKKVKEVGVTVSLDGQGADEQLAGYLSYLMPYFASMPILKIVKEVKSFIKVPYAKGAILKGVIMNLLAIFLSKKVANRIYYKKYKQNFIFDLNEKLKNDFETSLVGLIHYSDHVSMGHSIESRMPFMDYRLVEFLATVPIEYKLHNGWTKYIARLAFDKKIPDEITWRKDKMGWPIPEDYWFRGNLKKWFLKSINQSTYFNKKEKEEVKKQLNGGANITKLVRFLNVSVWEKSFFNEK